MSDLERRVAAWNPAPEHLLAGAAGSTEATKLLGEILRQPVPRQPPHTSAARPSRGRRERPRRPVVAMSLAAASAVLVALAWPALHSQEHSGRARSERTQQSNFVDFVTRKGYVVARITDPDAGAAQLTAAFRTHGLYIQVKTVPVSPSLVGTLIFVEGVPSIHSLVRKGCNVGGCPIGFVIPANFRGQGTVVVGRVASPGEGYAATADVFASGEVLHCTGLLGMPAIRALPILRARGLQATWWNLNDNSWPEEQSGSPSDNKRRTAEPVGYIVDGSAVSASRVTLDTTSELPSNPQFRSIVAGLNDGCG
jgi:hypothetical protein